MILFEYLFIFPFACVILAGIGLFVIRLRG